MDTWREAMESDWFPETEAYTPVEPVYPLWVTPGFTISETHLAQCSDPLQFYANFRAV